MRRIEFSGVRTVIKSPRAFQGIFHLDQGRGTKRKDLLVACFRNETPHPGPPNPDLMMVPFPRTGDNERRLGLGYSGMSRALF